MSKAIDTQLKLKEAAERFVKENPDFIYSQENHTWYFFNGRSWEEAKPHVESLIEEIWEESELLYDVHLKTLKKLLERKCLNKDGMNIDADLIINTPTGVLNLSIFLQSEGSQATGGNVEPHDNYRGKYLTMMTNANYIPGAPKPEKFLNFINNLCNHDPEMMAYLLTLLAYCLTGRTNHYLYLLFGLGRNGKGTLLSFMEILMGSYFCKIPAIKLSYRTKDSEALREIYKKRYKRLAVIDELSDDFRMNVALVKQLTGGDSLDNPYLTAPIGSFRPDFKLLIDTNHLPEVGSTQNVGIWERLKVLITRPPIKKEDRIDKFHLILAEEKDAVLTFLLDHYLDNALSDGLKAIPQRMALALEFKKFQENPVEYFVDKTIQIAPHPISKAQWLGSRYLHGQYHQFHLNVMNFFQEKLALGSESESHKLLVMAVSEKAFSLTMGKLGSFKKEVSGREFWQNLYFHSERVWSNNGAKAAPEWLEDKKNKFMNVYSQAFTELRRAEEMATPFDQAKAMIDMPNHPEKLFEEANPIADVPDNTAMWATAILLSQNKTKE
ncbi:hypothetical protein AGMMS49546_16740 [Spirochaetia bacterium]|nr:hypothetical protein AGMMS49546_16740 [Spirochaetia bacterium]